MDRSAVVSRKAARALHPDQGLQPFSQQLGALGDACELLGAGDEVVIECHGGPHGDSYIMNVIIWCRL